MKRRYHQRAVTGLARGMECQIRLVGICNFDNETTVPCHLRQAGLTGLCYIAESIFVAWGCSACHAYVDSHPGDVAIQNDFMRGIFRTQQHLLDDGVIVVAGREGATA
jgi:hypothetical protein